VLYQATFALSTTARRRRSSAWRFRQIEKGIVFDISG
jgi:hypothetical protein